MRDLEKYTIDDLRNYCTRLEAKIAGYKIQIQELRDKLEKLEKDTAENGNK